MKPVDELSAIAAQLVARVRDDEPEANARWLATTCPDPADRDALLYILAAAVPDDRPWSALVAWVTGPAETPEQRRQRNRDRMRALRARPSGEAA